MLFKSLLIIVSIIIVILFLWDVRKISHPVPSWVTDIRIAHRGMHDEFAAENTLQAFHQAVKNGFAIELDVQLTSDCKVVVFHDQNLKRLTQLSGELSHYTLQELRSARILGSNQGIPSLSEVLELVDGQVPIYIEIKKHSPDYNLERAVADLIKNYAGPFAIISFAPGSLRWFKKHCPNVLRGQTACAHSLYDATNIISQKIHNFALSMFCYNFHSKPNFIIYDIKCLPMWYVMLLSKFKKMIVYNVKSELLYKKSLAISHNLMFDYIGKDL